MHRLELELTEKQHYSNRLVEQFSRYCDLEGRESDRFKSARSHFSSIGSIEVEREVLKEEVVRLQVLADRWEAKYKDLEAKMDSFLEAERSQYEAKILQLAQEIVRLRNNPTL